MNNSFWITFVVNEAISVVAAYVAASKMSDAQKVAAEQLIASAQAFLITV